MTAKKTPAKASKKSTKTEAAPRAKKEGLRDPQARILRVLSKAKGGLTKPKINELCAAAGFATAEKFTQWMADPLGSVDVDNRKVAEERSGYPSLLTLKYVTVSEMKVGKDDDRTHNVYAITASGRAALIAYDKAQKEKAKEAAK